MQVPQPPIPLNELSRQALLGQYPVLLEPSADPLLDQIVALAARYFDAPIALITIVDRKRQWFRARVGIDVQETPRSASFCAYSVAIGDALEVCDATSDERFRCNPLVTGEPGIRYYAGVPLTLDCGIVLGNLCVIDTRARAPMSANDHAMLQQLASMAMSRINELRAATFIDGATGLHNRLRFDDDMQDALARGDAPLAVAIEVVSPAQLNDMLKSLGFHFLSEFTLAVRDSLRALLPKGWELYKISTLRFACSVPGAQAHGAHGVLAELVEAFDKPFYCQGIPVLPQLGVGVLQLDASDVPDDWMRLIVCAADEARTSGRGWAYYEDGMDAAQQRATRLLNDLAGAVRADDQLRLVYQPRIDLHDGRCLSVEALLRWRHPVLGEISPAEFIPLAERTALIHAVSFWVAKQAIGQISAWRQQGLAIKVAINVSAADLTNDHLSDEIIRLLAENGLTGDCLEVEFTESALIGDSSIVIAQLERLRGAGVNIAIDDFGSGYSNWSYLRDIPADTVKLDRSLMDDLRPGQKDWSIVRALISLAKELGMKVVAEGIEAPQTLQLMREWGCQEAQGFFISRPLEVAAAEVWLVNPAMHQAYRA